MTMSPEDLIWQTTTTAGTGPFVLSSPLLFPDGSSYRGFDIYANGTTVPYFRSAGAAFEDAEGTVNTTAGVSTITQTFVHKSSNGNLPVNWAAGGKQNVRISYTAGQAILRRNNGSEWSSVGDTFCGNVGAATDGVRGLSGGADGRIVRFSSSGTVVNAQNTDSTNALRSLLFRLGGKFYRPGDMVPWASSLSTGTHLWLGDNTTPFVSAVPAVSFTVHSVYLGEVYAAGLFHFAPGSPNAFIAPSATGGSANQILRFSSTGVLVAASSSDSAAQLSYLWVRGSDGNPYEPIHLVPFSGVTAGTLYYVGSAGALTTTPPVPDGVTTQVLVGMGWDAGILMFDPQRPIWGARNLSGTQAKQPLQLENGLFVI